MFSVTLVYIWKGLTKVLRDKVSFNEAKIFVLLIIALIVPERLIVKRVNFSGRS